MTKEDFLHISTQIKMNNDDAIGLDNELLHKKEIRHFWEIPVLRQSFVILGLISLMFSAGIGLGTATVMLPQLKKSNDILVDEVMSSWIYSAHGFGSVPAVIFIPYLSQWKGYKIVFILICIPMISSFLVLYFATNAVHILIAGICQGVTMGGNLTLGLIAISEFAEPRIRSLYLVMKSASYFWGIWIANIIGTFLHWRYIPLFAIWPPIFGLSSCFFWPDGPYWLANKGKIEQCKKSFQWLRGPGNGLEELKSIIEKQVPKHNANKKENFFRRMKEIVVLRQFYMPFLVNCVSCSLYYFTGKIVCAVYALVIIKDITKDESAAYMGMLIIDAVTVVGMYIGSYLALKVRRRSMYLSTSAVTIILLYILSAYLSLVEYKVISQNATVSLSLLILYSLSVSWGPMVLCTATLSEITPMRFKCFIVGACSVVFWSLHSATLKLAPIFFNNIGIHGSFGVYGTLTLICWLFLYKYLPETSNKTLQELELYFVKDKERQDIEKEHENEIMLQDFIRKD